MKKLSMLAVFPVCMAVLLSGCGKSGSDDKGKKQTEPDLSSVKFIDADQGGEFRKEFWAALADNGDLYMWGSNKAGQLGIGDTGDFHCAVKVLEDVTKVELGLNFAAAIDKDGSLYMWGGNDSGQLGTGSTDPSTKPQKVLDNVSDVLINDQTVWALVGDKELYVWGENPDDKYKADTKTLTSPEKITDEVAELAYPYYINGAGRLMGFSKGEPKEITGGIKKAFKDDDYTYAITKKNVLVRLAKGMYSYDEELLENAQDFKSYTGIKGNEFYGALTNDGTLYMWGSNYDHRSGDSSEENLRHPTEVMNNVSQFELGRESTYAVDNTGTLYSWGQNSVGQLCNGTTKGFNEPTPVLSDVSKIKAWSSCIAIITNDGKLYIGGSAGRIDITDTGHGQFETPICVNDKSKRADILTKGNSDPVDNGLDQNGLPGEVGVGGN